MGDSRELETDIGESSGEITKRKRGRPAKDGGRKNQFRLMFSDEEIEKLRKNSKKLGKSQAEFLRDCMLINCDLIEKKSSKEATDVEFDENWDVYHDGFDELEGI